MSKKSKKRERHVSGGAKIVASAMDAPINFVAAKAQPRDQFNPDYTSVVKDLKRIGGLASFFIVILIVLTFFLR